ncbi:expressed unknown protein [Ectocarpus siliculosus]|uniref:Uncharacterized protein n=1 Tax=Ectocarpus siliculosus TaxID=2880 RepID=D8LMI0_ECTSI|nr:expressed unknown protein [Ectocarpus siliculosus]|eukprot:CBN77590.1 expressed unknown protein [Ectocarpus siliculosus]
MMQMTRMNLRHGAASLLALWCTTNQFRVGHSNSAVSCPSETLSCLADDDCSSCLTALDETSDTINPVFADCNVLFASVCTFAANNGCDLTNPLLEDFAACVADEEFSCPGFVSCADANSAAGTASPAPAVATTAPTAVATPAPAAVASASPTGSTEDVGVTSSPSGSDAGAEAETVSGGVSHTVAESMKTTLAVVCGLAILLSA